MTEVPLSWKKKQEQVFTFCSGKKPQNTDFITPEKQHRIHNLHSYNYEKLITFTFGGSKTPQNNLFQNNPNSDWRERLCLSNIFTFDANKTSRNCQFHGNPKKNWRKYYVCLQPLLLTLKECHRLSLMVVKITIEHNGSVYLKSLLLTLKVARELPVWWSPKHGLYRAVVSV